MARISIAVISLFISTLFVNPAYCGEGKFKLASETGRLLRGTVYKHSGITREGVITIRTASGILRAAPVYRYDFDILYGKIDGSLYSFLMADVSEITLLPPEEQGWPVNIMLRNGVLHKIFLSSESKAIVGSSDLSIKEVDVVTDNYGENAISGGDVYKIVFHAPAKEKDEDMPGLVNEFLHAIEVGKRDGLVDDNLYVILDNIQKRMKAKLKGD